MYRLLAAITVLLMFITNYASLGWIKAAVVLAAYMLLAKTFHGLAEKADRKKRKKRRAHRSTSSVSSV